VEASLKAGVTLTGAYDDACACYFGGVVITDNMKRKILKRFKPKGKLRVLIHVPKMKRYTHDVDPKRFRGISPSVQVAHREALRGNYWNSMTLNGLIYSMALGHNTTAVATSLKAGAIAAGLTGKGPATVAIVPESKKDSVRSAWRRISGRIIDTSFNFQKAKVWRL
jgi:shikimate kinase